MLLSPALADRPVVSRPITPFTVPPGEEATVFVSSPLWVRLDAGPKAKLLLEIPTQRPSDTWFGPSTMHGELCYATRTHSRLRLEEVPPYADRAVTPVHLRNEAGDPLRLERLNLPVPFLSLYAASANGLWTQTVSMVRERDGSTASLKLGEGPPGIGGRPVLVAGPRTVPDRRVLVRAFGALFGLPGLFMNARSEGAQMPADSDRTQRGARRRTRRYVDEPATSTARRCAQIRVRSRGFMNSPG